MIQYTFHALSYVRHPVYSGSLGDINSFPVNEKEGSQKGGVEVGRGRKREERKKKEERRREEERRKEKGKDKERKEKEGERKGEMKENSISKFLAQSTLKIRVLFSHFISLSPVARRKYLPKHWIKPQMQPIWKKWRGKWPGKGGLASGAPPAFSLNIWWERAAKHNTVLLAIILPSKVLTFGRAEDLKQSYNLVFFK